MRRLTFLSATVFFCALGTGVGAAETGTIAGRVINAATGRPQAGVTVVLSSGTEAGTDELARRATTDRRGRYRFEDLPTGEERFYALDARFRGGTFAGRAISIPDDTTTPPVIETSIRVWPTTSDPGAIVLRRDDLFVISTTEGAAVIESITVTNVTERAYIGRGGGSDGDEGSSGATVGFALPRGARNVRVVDADLDIPGLVELDTGVAATVAFPPGESRVTYSYEIPGSGSTIDLSRPALYPTLELSVFAEPPLEIRSNRLVRQDAVTIEGTRYERWSARDDLDAGDPLQAIAVREAGLSVVPLVGILVGMVLLGFAGAFVMRRRSSPKSSRDELLVAVARLDMAFEAGELPEERWRSERARLRSRLERVGGPR